jgi:hypothetical protein
VLPILPLRKVNHSSIEARIENGKHAQRTSRAGDMILPVNPEANLKQTGVTLEAQLKLVKLAAIRKR